MNTLCIKEIFCASWRKLDGVKGPTWFITLVALLPLLIVQIALINFGFMFYHETPPLIWTELVMPIVSNFMMGIFMAGMIMPAIRQARGERINIKTGFYYFRRAPQMMTLMLITSSVTSLLMYAATLLNVSHGLTPMDFSVWRGLSFFISALVFLFCYIAVALIADAKLTAFEAILVSIKKVAAQFHKIVLIVMLYFILLLIIASPLLLAAVLHNMGKTSASGILVLTGVPIFAFCMVWLLPLNALLQAHVYLKLTRPN